MLTTYNPARSITDAALDFVNGDYQLTYMYNGIEKGKQFTDVQLMKTLRKSGMIQSHQTYAGEILVITENDKTPLWIFATELDKYELIQFIEKC